MEKIIIGLILAVIPIFSWCIQYYLSSKSGNLELFKNHIATYYLDWIFVIFNLFFAFSFIFSKNIFIYALIFSFIGNILIHIFWFRLHLKEKRPIYMFELKNKKILPAGIWHFFFSFFQLSLVLMFLFSSEDNAASYACLASLVAFFLLTIPSSRKIHGKVSMTDIPFLIMGSIIILIKLYFLIIS